MKVKIIPVQISRATSTYHWANSPSPCLGLQTLCDGYEEDAKIAIVFFKALAFFWRENVQLVFLPSYSPARYLALFAAAKLLGVRTVMMNESHAGTEKAKGLTRWLKSQIIEGFDAALVGGEPHKRHFASLGLPVSKIFTGYDAVDNNFFTLSSEALRASDSRSAFGLPSRYFLSLGRMVYKKNLSTLINAYKRYVQQLADENQASTATGIPPVSLVFVGSGEEEVKLELLARRLGLRVIDRREHGLEASFIVDPKSVSSPPFSDGHEGTVYFYGFRQIHENLVFYSLAEAFILPSLYEEWGLVVNEAMACSLPVVVSCPAGCSEDLLPRGSSSSFHSVGLEERANGFVFDPNSPEALCEALHRLATAESAERQRLGRCSLAVVSQFGCENFARQALLAAEAACQ